MQRRIALVPVLLSAAAALLLLAGCGPVVPGLSSHSAKPTDIPGATLTPTAAPTPTATPSATPTPVNAADYLVEGTPGVFDADGFWTGHYAFFTDASQVVRCDMFIFSGDPGSVNCGLTPGNAAKRGYALPAGASTTCDDGAEFPSDGTQVVMGGTGFDSTQALAGCIDQASYDPAIVAKTKVLPPDRSLTVAHDAATYTCTVHAAAATCTDSDGGRIVFGAAVLQLG